MDSENERVALRQQLDLERKSLTYAILAGC